MGNEAPAFSYLSFVSSVGGNIRMYLEIYAPLFPSRFLELLILYDFIRYSGRGIDSKEIKFYLPRMQALQQKRLKINLWIKEDCILFLYHYFYSCEFFYYSRLTIRLFNM